MKRQSTDKRVKKCNKEGKVANKRCCPASSPCKWCCLLLCGSIFLLLVVSFPPLLFSSFLILFSLSCISLCLSSSLFQSFYLFEGWDSPLICFFNFFQLISILINTWENSQLSASCFIWVIFSLLSKAVEIVPWL